MTPAFRQYIVIRYVPRQDRIDKLPLHPVTLTNHSAHDPAVWMSKEEAQAIATTGADLGVGFVFTEDDPFWFVDLDHCLQADGSWSPFALSVCARFPGAAMEVSYSGTGLHIFGCGKVPMHACKSLKVAGLEMYHKGRFVALTDRGAQGDVWLDHTAAIEALVTEYLPPTKADGIEWTEGPRSDWRGPADDDELIRRMLRSVGAKAAFGFGASFADLWDANVEVLAKHFPERGSKDRPFAESEAEGALSKHLAFWTGCDCPRMERLMRRSKLVREKWDSHATYLALTIVSAISGQKEVLRDDVVEPPNGVPVQAPVAMGAVPEVGTAVAAVPAVVEGSRLLSIDDQVSFFAGCTYVIDMHRVLVPGGHLLPPERFKVIYGGRSFIMDPVNAARPSKDAWEAFTQSQALEHPRADRACFRPDLAPGVIVSLGSRREVNQWWPPGVPSVAGDASPFLRHLELLFPNERDRAIVLGYCAALVQRPGVKFQWCPLIQGAEGNGKTIITECVLEAVGERYSHFVRADLITEKFNAWMLNRVFIGVEDIYVPRTKMEVWNTIKPMITGRRQPIEPKGVDQDTRNVCCNFILNSNHMDAVQKTGNDRRLAVFYTPQQTADDVERDMGNGYFQALQGWLKEQGGYAIVTHLLQHHPIPAWLDLRGRAPRTGSTDEAVYLSHGSLEQEVMERIAQGVSGFKGGWVSSMALDKMLRQIHAEQRMPINARKAMMAGMGYVLHPALKDGRVDNPTMVDGGKPRLYLRPDSPAMALRGGADVARVYENAQK